MWRRFLHLVFLVQLVTPAWAGQVYVFSVVPQFTPVDIGVRWTPLLRRLEAAVGAGFQLRVFDKNAAFETDFQRGGPDFIYLNPYHMVMAAEAQGYVPLVRSGTPLRGILVADRESPVRSLADLQGRRLAFPSPNAFGASLYLRALLAEKEKIAFSPVYAGTHQNVYRHVLLGEEAAGGGIESTLEREPASVKNRLRVLYTTPDTPSHPVAVHPRVPREVREKFVLALRALGRNEAGRKLLADVDLEELQPADYAHDYQPLEKLKLNGHLGLEKK